MPVNCSVQQKSSLQPICHFVRAAAQTILAIARSRTHDIVA
jgi:hypothetical protein